MRDDFFAPDFFAPERLVFLERTDLTMRFAAGTATWAVFTAAFIAPAACRAVRLTAGIIGLSLSALFPTMAPTTPPRTAPTGPPTAPRTAPVAAPASDFEIGGMSMFFFDLERGARDLDFFVINFGGLVFGCRSAVESCPKIDSRLTSSLEVLKFFRTFTRRPRELDTDSGSPGDTPGQINQISR